MILIIQIDYIVRVPNDKHLPVKTLECNRCVLDAKSKSKSKIKRTNHELISFSIEPFNFTLEDFVATLHLRWEKYALAISVVYYLALWANVDITDFFFFDSYWRVPECFRSGKRIMSSIIIQVSKRIYELRVSNLLHLCSGMRE